MTVFRSRGISLRLTLGFGLVLLMLLAIAGGSLAQLRRLQQQADDLVVQHMGMLDALGRMQANAGERSVLLRDLVLNDSLKAQKEVTARLKANAAAQAQLSGRFADLADSSSVGSARASLQKMVEL